jgi:formate dehydrogenase alpha subunit
VESVTISLNGVEVSGSSGTTILELARESGVHIPTLCSHPALKPAGACRICIVEEEKSGALLASCVTPIAQGQVIVTDSPRVLENRRRILKLLLASHPDTCMVCDKGNRCTLRTLASELGIGLIEYQKIPAVRQVQEVNPFIERDLSKCVLCGKCIRVDQELVVVGAIDYIDRGDRARPTTFNDVPLEQSECTFCGACVAACPTGALMEKDRVYTGSGTSLGPVVCPYCGCGCTLELEVKDGKVVRAHPAEDAAVNHGAACVLGSYALDFINHPDRLTRPLIKKDGELQEATWEAALTLVAEKLGGLRDEAGGAALGVYGSAHGTNEENYLLQRFARTALGTNNIDNGSRLYTPAGRAGLGASIGYAGSTTTIDGLERSPVIVVIGADPDVSAPVVAYAIRRAVKYGGASLVLVDPRETDLASFAGTWLRPKPGTDAVLLNGLARIIVRESRHDVASVSRRTENYAGWTTSLEKFTPAYVEKVTGVPRREVQRVAGLLAAAECATIVYGDGIAQQRSGAAAVGAIGNLAMLTGNDGSRGGILALFRDSNACGACDLGALPDMLPGYQDIGDDAARQKFARAWSGTLPESPGLTIFQMLEAARANELRGMMIMGENPAGAFPQPESVKAALAALDFLVVADLFLTETAALADVVLPAAAAAEKEGSYTNLGGRVQHSCAVLPPPGESLPEGEIILRLARAMNAPLPFQEPADVVEEIEALVPFYHPVGEADLEPPGMEPAAGGKPVLGARRLYGGLFPRGFGRFSVTADLPEDGADADYPFVLLPGPGRFAFGSGARTARSARLAKLAPDDFIALNPADARALKLKDGNQVQVTSAAGSMLADARITDAVPRGMVHAARGRGLLDLFGTALTPETGAPALASCAVRLERVTTDDRKS